MTNPGRAESLSKEAQAARSAVEQGKNIRNALRNITLDALKRGRLNTQEMRTVVREVLQGVTLGANKAGEGTLQALSDALAGIDDALASSAEASKLAIEEAAGRLRDYRKQDLERAFKDMQALEGMFLDTIKDVADHTAGEAREILHGMLRHARNSGTSAGATVTQSIASLEQKLGRSLQQLAAEGSDVALDAGSKLAEAASGFLAGIAEALDAKAKDMRNPKK